MLEISLCSSCPSWFNRSANENVCRHPQSVESDFDLRCAPFFSDRHGGANENGFSRARPNFARRTDRGRRICRCGRGFVCVFAHHKARVRRCRGGSPQPQTLPCGVLRVKTRAPTPVRTRRFIPSSPREVPRALCACLHGLFSCRRVCSAVRS